MTTPENPYTDPISEVPDDKPLNPYASPLTVDDTPKVLVPADVASRWFGGWPILVPAVGLICLGVMVALDLSGPGGFQLLAVPALAVLFLALLVRGMHYHVNVNWFSLLGVATLMGLAGYVLFVPVCIVVGIPTALVVEATMSPYLGMDFPWTAAMFATIFVIALIVAGVFRLFMRKRSREQYLENWEQQSAAPFNYPGMHPPSKNEK